MARIATLSPVARSGIDAADASAIFSDIAQFAGYGFNKSHAAAYAAIAFRTAWLRTHHPEAFFAAAMNVELDDVEAISTYASELRVRGIPLMTPCVNTSGASFAPIPLKRRNAGFGVSYGLAALRGIGVSVAQAIEAERRRGGVFKSAADAVARLSAVANKRALTALVQSGALDAISQTRAGALLEIGGGARGVADARAGQMSMFDMMATPSVSANVPEMDRLDVLDGEFDVLGHYMSGHPLDPMRQTLIAKGLYFSRYILRDAEKAPRQARMAAVVSKIDTRRIKDGEMTILTLSDPDGAYEAVCFGDQWGPIRKMVKRKAALVFTMAINDRDGQRRLTVEDAREMTEAEHGVNAAAAA